MGKIELSSAHQYDHFVSSRVCERKWKKFRRACEIFLNVHKKIFLLTATSTIIDFIYQKWFKGRGFLFGL